MNCIQVLYSIILYRVMCALCGENVIFTVCFTGT